MSSLALEMKKLWIGFCMALLSLALGAQDKVHVSYIGNMGILLQHKEDAILIDGLHEFYGKDYLYPSSKLVQSITSTIHPNLLLFTHLHGDHFSKDMAAAYLGKNKTARLIAAEDVTSQIHGFDPQINTVATNAYTKQHFTYEGCAVSVFRMNHKNPRHKTVQNLGFIVRLGNIKVLHVGDTGWFEEIKMFQKLSLREAHIDVAILPYWMLLHKNAEELIRMHINPSKLVVTHISPRIPTQELSRMKQAFPKATFFTRLQETIELQ